MSKVEEMLADVPSEGDILTDDEKKPEGENGDKTEDSEPSESPAENNEDGDAPASEGVGAKDDKVPDPSTPSEDEQVPFHKNPRWKKIYSENKELKSTVGEMKEKLSKLDDIEARLDSREKSQEEIPSWFGGDEPAWKAYKVDEESKFEKYRERIESERQQLETKKAADADKWATWVRTSLEEVAEENNLDFEKDKTTKNELMDVMNKYSPVDTQGNLDFRKGYDLLKLTKGTAERDKAKAKKAAASTADSTPSPEKPKRDFLTGADFNGGKDWRDV